MLVRGDVPLVQLSEVVEVVLLPFEELLYGQVFVHFRRALHFHIHLLYLVFGFGQVINFIGRLELVLQVLVLYFIAVLLASADFTLVVILLEAGQMIGVPTFEHFELDLFNVGVVVSAGCFKAALVAQIVSGRPVYFVRVEEALKVRNELGHHELLADFKGLDPLAAARESGGEAVDDELLIEQVGVLVEFDGHEADGHLSAHAGERELDNFDEMLHEGMVLAGLLRVDALDSVDDPGLGAAG